MPFAPDGNSYMKREVLTAWVEEGKGQTPNQPLAHWVTGAIMEMPGMLGIQAALVSLPHRGGDFPGVHEPSLFHSLHTTKALVSLCQPQLPLIWEIIWANKPSRNTELIFPS